METRAAQSTLRHVRRENACRARIGWTRLVIAAPLLFAGCTRMVDGALMGMVSAPASAVAARGGADPMPGDPQTLMTRLRPARDGDADRANAIAAEVERSIEPFRDVRAAVGAGYRSFPAEPAPDQRIIHYVHQGLSRREARRLDVTRPGALLYERMPDGSLRLVGAMFTAPLGASLEELDARVPLSVTQWHLHQNVCVPRPVWDAEAWARKAPDGRPLFGPGSPVATPEGCREIRGRFLPTVFGWMAHVYVFAENPADRWNAMYGHAPHGGHPHHE